MMMHTVQSLAVKLRVNDGRKSTIFIKKKKKKKWKNRMWAALREAELET